MPDFLHRENRINILQSRVLFAIVNAFLIIGFSLCIGSIAIFITMDIVANNKPSTELWYWQRVFVNAIIQAVTIPGAWLFFTGNLGFFFTMQNKKETSGILLLILSLLVVINAQIIIPPIAKEIDKLAVEQFQTSKFLNEFEAQKRIEDTCGEINSLLLILYLGIFIHKITKAKSKVISP